MRTVLRNKLGLTDRHDADVEEFRAYKHLTMASLESLESDQQLTVDFIRILHRTWLQDIYDFAGEYRTVNVSKDGFPFCVAQFIPQEMERYEHILTRRTPCDRMDDSELTNALAEVHGEFILIHPFREGNGRLARWISSLMAVQAGYPILSFALEAENKAAKETYFQAIRRFATDPSDLTNWFSAVLTRTPR